MIYALDTGFFHTLLTGPEGSVEHSANRLYTTNSELLRYEGTLNIVRV